MVDDGVLDGVDRGLFDDVLGGGELESEIALESGSGLIFRLSVDLLELEDVILLRW